jgi:hypothetical protein
MVVSATVLAGSLGLCLPREEEGLPVHDRRILRDGVLRLRKEAGIATSNTPHDLTVNLGDVRK